MNKYTAKWGHEIKTAGHLFVSSRREILEYYVCMQMKMTQKREKINLVMQKRKAMRGKAS